MEIDKEYLKKLIESKQKEVEFSYEYSFSEESLQSKEYKAFKETMEKDKKKMHWYEKLANMVDRINLEVSKNDRERIEKEIRFSGLNIKPKHVIILPILFLSSMFILWIIEYILIKVLEVMFYYDITKSESVSLFQKILYPGNWPGLIKIFPLIIGVLGAYYLYKYPSMRSTINRIRYGEQLLMAFVYMIVYLKTSGNLEGAVRYAAQNTSGKVSRDLKEILWKLETRQYNDIYEGLKDYADVWKDHMKEFSQSIYLINEAMLEPNQSRKDLLLEKALSVILDSYDEKMKSYVRALEMPIQVIHAIGIILPVLGMVVLPILTILLSDSLSNLSFYLIVFYNVILPIGLLFFITNTLQKRPATFGRAAIKDHPSLPKRGFFRIKSQEGYKDIKISHIIYTLTFLIVMPLSLIYLYTYATSPNSGFSSFISMSLILSFSATVGAYALLSSIQRLKFRREIEEIEKEFEDALFALGNALATKIPIEKALERTINDIQGLKIRDLFLGILRNMHQFSLTFKDALFHERYGVLKYYPSDLIRNIMNILSSVVEKGTESAALAMITISRYLRNIKTTQLKIDDLLSSTLSSMRFNAYVLIPVVGGVIVAVSKLVLVLLLKMSGIYINLTQQLGTEDTSQLLETGFIFNVDQAIPASLTLLIVGTYIVEILYILGLFIARTQYGIDDIMEKNEIWKLTLIGSLVFVSSYIVINTMFSGIIDSVITGLE